jgi:hypothetical protein
MDRILAHPDWSIMRYLDGKEFVADTLEPSSGWLQKYIHPSDQPTVLRAINEAIRRKETFELEFEASGLKCLIEAPLDHQNSH